MSKYTNDEIYTKYLLTNKDFMKHWVNILHDNYNWDIVDAVRFEKYYKDFYNCDEITGDVNTKIKQFISNYKTWKQIFND